jgi:hypothetical protein
VEQLPPARQLERQSWFRRNALTTALLAVAVLASSYALVVFNEAMARPASHAGAGVGTSPRPSVVPHPPQPSATPTVSVSPTRPPRTKRPAEPLAAAGWPGPTNTGVPRGVALSEYRGPCTITRGGTVIEAKIVRCKILNKARDVVIRRSKVLAVVENRGSATMTIEDTEVDGGRAYEPAVGYENLKVYRSNVHGGQASVNCHTKCLIKDSWLHGQYIPADGDWHLDAFLSNGGSNVTLIHNTLACDGKQTPNDGGCTADAAVFGDFAPNSYYTFDRNYFVSSMQLPYCFYGGSSQNKPYSNDVHHIVFTNNVFQRGRNGKCGYYGAVTSFDRRRPGNVWSGNVFEDGKTVAPAN